MREINEGDKVKCFWVIDGAEVDGIVLHTPQDVGDLWYIKDSLERIHAINPNCSDFSSIIKTKEDNPEEQKDEMAF